IERLDRNDPGDWVSPPIAPGYSDRPLHAQSHGESFLAMLSTRLRGNGLYLLDEPEAALSPMRQLTMLTVLHRLVGAGAQLIIATHSPILLAYPNATILQFGEHPVAQIAFDETD